MVVIHSSYSIVRAVYRLMQTQKFYIGKSVSKNGYQFHVHYPAKMSDVGGRQEPARILAKYVTALRSGHILISLGMCASVLRTRPTHARDLYIAYTNQTFAMVLRGVSLCLLAVRKFSNSQQSQRDLLREAGSILEEVLNGREEMTLDAQISRAWVDNSRRAGLTMRDNIETAHSIIECMLERVSV